MNTSAFINNHNYDYENLAYYLDIDIQNYIINNTIDVNKQIINDYMGDIYDILVLYNNHIDDLKDLCKQNKEFFYQQLAHITLFIYLYPIILDEYSYDDVNFDIETLFEDI